MASKLENFLRKWYGLPLIFIIIIPFYFFFSNLIYVFSMTPPDRPIYSTLGFVILLTVIETFISYFLGFIYLGPGFFHFFRDLFGTPVPDLIILIASIPLCGFIIYSYVQRKKLKKIILYILFFIIFIIFLISLRGCDVGLLRSFSIQ
jgi:hypothetical protein